MLENDAHTLPILALYAAIVCSFGAAFLGWAIYNIARFRGVQRRLAPAPLKVADLAAAFELPAETIERLQHARIARLDHDAGGRIARVESGPAAPPSDKTRLQSDER